MLKNYPEILERIKKNEVVHENECSGADILRAVRDGVVKSFRFEGVLWEISLIPKPTNAMADVIIADDEKMPRWDDLTYIIKGMIARTQDNMQFALLLDDVFYQVHIDILESER